MTTLIENQSRSWNQYHPLEQQHHNYTMMMESRQRFLRSYPFSRKKTLAEKIKGSLIRVKKVLWSRLRSARRIKRVVFSVFRIKCGFYRRRRRWLSRANNYRASTKQPWCC